MDDEAYLAIRRATANLEQSLCDLSAWMEAEELTKAQRRTVISATAKMADATTQMKNMLAKERS